MDVRKVIGENVRRARVLADLTQEEVGERLGVDRAYISGLECGKRNPTAITLWRLATVFGLEPARLLERPEPLTPIKPLSRPKRKSTPTEMRSEEHTSELQ